MRSMIMRVSNDWHACSAQASLASGRRSNISSAAFRETRSGSTLDAAPAEFRDGHFTTSAKMASLSMTMQCLGSRAVTLRIRFREHLDNAGHVLATKSFCDGSLEDAARGGNRRRSFGRACSIDCITEIFLD